MIVLPGCVPEIVERKLDNIVWPPPPAEPRIRFIEEILSKDDLGNKDRGGWLRNLIAGDEGSEDRLKKPYGIAVDDSRRIYVTDIGRVFVFDKRNRTLSFIGRGPETVRLSIPIGIAVSPDNKVYISDTTYGKIFMYKSDGRFIDSIGKDELKGPSGLVIDAKRKRLYVADTKKNVVIVYSLDGNVIFSIDGRDTEKGKFNFPTNIAVDREGNIYVVDSGNLTIQIFNPDGKFLGAISGGGKSGLFVRPKGIAVDSKGNVYVVDAAAQKFFVFDKKGKLSFSVGESGVEPGQFFMPAGIAIDPEDRIYIVDQMNGRVQIFQCLERK
jgi:DNA-binding beta-propeller fold protein YncE